jgi:hypothetical protein
MGSAFASGCTQQFEHFLEELLLLQANAMQITSNQERLQLPRVQSLPID